MAVLTRLARTSLLAVAVLSASAIPVRAESLEDAIKATYIYKFAPFVTWPGTAHGDAFNVCVFGSDAVSALLPQATTGQEIDGRQIVVRPLAGADIPADCRILYVADSPATPALLAAAHGKPILTVSSGNAPEHGIVRLIVIDHHVRFDVDTRLAAEAGLSVSSKLLSLAHAVTPQGRE